MAYFSEFMIARRFPQLARSSVDVIAWDWQDVADFLDRKRLRGPTDGSLPIMECEFATITRRGDTCELPAYDSSRPRDGLIHP